MSESDDLRLKRIEKNQERILEGLKGTYQKLEGLHDKVDEVLTEASEAAAQTEYDDTAVHNMLVDVRYEVRELFERFIGDEDDDE